MSTTPDVGRHSGLQSSAADAMTRARALVVVCLVAAAIIGCQRTVNSVERAGVMEGMALVGGTLIDGTGSAPVRNSVVLIRGERIEQVGTIGSLNVPPGYQQISTEGLTVLPGLWDMHVHLVYAMHPGSFREWFEKYRTQFETVTMPATAGRLLKAGVTSARDLGAPLDSILRVKARIERGEIPGPTMYVAGPLLTHGPFGPPGSALTPDPVMTHLLPIADVADAHRQARRLVDAGVDVVKVINAEQWSLDELKAVVEEAHARRLKVAAHAFSDQEIRQGLAAGVDDFQHIPTTAARDGFSPELLAAIRDRVRMGPPLYWTVTVGNRLTADDFPDPEVLDDPANFQGLPAAMTDDVRRALAARQGTRGPDRQADPLPVASVKRAVAQLQDAGVELVFGLDTGAFGVEASTAQWADADLWVRVLGIAPMTVIRKMTSDAARLMGVEDVSGAVRPGLSADVIAVRGDPLHYMNVLRDPPIVIKRGRRYR